MKDEDEEEVDHIHLIPTHQLKSDEYKQPQSSFRKEGGGGTLLDFGRQISKNINMMIRGK